MLILKYSCLLSTQSINLANPNKFHPFFMLLSSKPNPIVQREKEMKMHLAVFQQFCNKYQRISYLFNSVRHILWYLLYASGKAKRKFINLYWLGFVPFAFIYFAMQNDLRTKIWNSHLSYFSPFIRRWCVKTELLNDCFMLKRSFVSQNTRLVKFRSITPWVGGVVSWKFFFVGRI